MTIFPRLLATTLFLGLSLVSTFSQALTFNIGGGARYVYLQVGTGSNRADNSTIDTMRLALSGVTMGNGVSQIFTTNIPNNRGSAPGTLTCSSTSQVYVSARQRRTVGSATRATLSVRAQVLAGPATFSLGDISWTTDGSAGIAAGSFNGSVQTLGSIDTREGLENCLTFRYANTSLLAAGTYSIRATYTLVSP